MNFCEASTLALRLATCSRRISGNGADEKVACVSGRIQRVWAPCALLYAPPTSPEVG